MKKRIYNKKFFIFLGAIFLSFLSIHLVGSIINSQVTHSAGNILILVNGSEMNLQQAVNSNYTIGLSNSIWAIYNVPFSFGHGANEIWVSVNGTEKTLQNAIQTIGLCGNFSTPYSSTINHGHYANEFNITLDGINMSLQNAIDTGKFCVKKTILPDFSTSCKSATWHYGCPDICSGIDYKCMFYGKRENGILYMKAQEIKWSGQVFADSGWVEGTTALVYSSGSCNSGWCQATIDQDGAFVSVIVNTGCQSYPSGCY